MNQKLGRNDPCWCGYRRKYKHCHLGRVAQSPLPPQAIAARILRTSAHRTCLHPTALKKSCGKVVSAHTLQRARVLQEIAGPDNHVLTFYPFEPEPNGRLKVHRRGWYQASTFAAFCDQHDRTTFAPLETKPFSGTKEQIFLIAYRAVCWELYQKTRALKAVPTLRNLMDRGAPEHMQRRVQRILSVQNAGLRKGLADLNKAKQRMDYALLTNDYSLFRAHEFQLEGPFPEFLAQFLFAHCENTYFSPTWWHGLTEGDRAFLECLMANTNPYYYPPEYDLSRSVAPWRLASQRRL